MCENKSFKISTLIHLMATTSTIFFTNQQATITQKVQKSSQIMFNSIKKKKKKNRALMYL